MVGIQALTGRFPYDLRSNPKTGEIIWREQLAEPSPFDDILEKMVCQNIEERYQTVREVLDAIAALPSSATIPLPSCPLPPAPGVGNTAPSQFQSQRTLAAIAFTDGVGFSAKISANEEHTKEKHNREEFVFLKLFMT